MNLDDLKKLVLARKGKAVEIPEWGISITFLPIGFHRGLDVFTRFDKLERNSTGGIKITEEAVGVFADAISASAANDAGERFLDSDEGRLFLKEQSIGTLEKLTKAALQAAGAEVADVKNSETPVATEESPTK